jgi:hypothetical protein
MMADKIEKVMVILRDGRKLQGVFRSYDQYGKLVTIRHGVMLIRSLVRTLSLSHPNSWPLLDLTVFHPSINSILCDPFTNSQLSARINHREITLQAGICRQGYR